MSSPSVPIIAEGSEGAAARKALLAWFAERGVTRFKTPERVIVVDKLPLLSAGKPDRTALRHRLSSA